MLDRLYAIRYGKGFKYGGPEFAFLYYLAKVGDKWVLIDTGFSSSNLARNMGITMLPIRNEIQAIVMPEQISDILITHSHWDHIDDIDKYTKARIYLSQKTFDKAVSENCESTRKCLHNAKANNRVCIIASGMKLLDTFTYEEVCGHAEDSGVFFFEHGDSKYCITGDECFSIDYFVKNIAIDNAYDVGKNVRFTNRYNEAGVIPLPSHDGSVLLRYGQVSENIARIVV
ncbi:MAG: MBL fold metallo-hydrolase [Lachnospiraceae bacterium]|nr:MBL fold metallo-hydrolase [Lachnospiraceae bacterium]